MSHRRSFVRLLGHLALPGLLVAGAFGGCGGRTDLNANATEDDASAGVSGGGAGGKVAKGGSDGNGGAGGKGSGGSDGSGAGGSDGSGAGGSSGSGTEGSGTGGSGTEGSGTGGSGAISSGGSAGTSLVCNGEVCQGVPVPVGGITIEPCCSENRHCGLDMSVLAGLGIEFRPRCQEKNQPGELTPRCPTGNLTASGFNVRLPGCCRPNGLCGYMADQVAVVDLGLGCVDSTPFLDGGTPPRCDGSGTGGSGGTGTGSCNPAFCPNFGFGSPCCVASDGPCGVDVGNGCITFGPDAGSTGGSGGSGGVDAGAPGQISCGDGFCVAGEECCVTSTGPDFCSAGTGQCTCSDPGCEVTVITCDGPEDCSSGHCCGVFSFMTQQYLRSECQDACGAPNERELCHPGQSCPNANETCSNSPALPPNLFRCN